MRAFPPRPIILAALSAFERRASARLLRLPRTGEFATPVMTRVSAEKAAQKHGSDRLSDHRPSRRHHAGGGGGGGPHYRGGGGVPGGLLGGMMGGLFGHR
jgi:hypothetical protein